MKISTEISAIDIRSLRRQLGKTQEEMADQLGMSHRGYQAWESGERRPRGAALKALLDLYPDKEALTASDRMEKARPKRQNHAQVSRTANSKDEDDENLRHFNDAMTGLQLLFDAASAGHMVAKNELANVADKLMHRAMVWRRLKYFKT